MPGTAQALFMLLCGPARGGGDITVPGTEQVVGRWAGDRIALVGDYAAAEDIKDFPYLDCVYSLCHDVKEIEGRIADRGAAGKPRLREAFKKYGAFKDISEIVCKGIEHVFEGKYEGDGWRSFKPGPDSFLNRT